MPSNTATAVMQPPSVRQPGNAPIMEDRAVQEEFLTEMDRLGGYLRACRQLGISHMAVARQRVREPAFDAEVRMALDKMRTRLAEETMELARLHVNSHLSGPGAWDVEVDPDTGEVVLDDDFEPVRRSRLSMRSAVEAHREMRATIDRGDGPTIAIQNVNEVVAQVPSSAPRLIRPGSSVDLDSIEDAEIIEETHDAKE